MAADSAPQWPFVGRERDLERLVAAVSGEEHRGCVVGGPAGVGKTSLVRTALTGLPDVHWAHASPASSTVPFAALADLLLFADVDAADPTSYLMAARETLRSGTGRPVLVIDDAPLLDRASVILVAQLVRAGDVTAVLTARRGQTLADELGRFVDDRELDVVDLEPLDPETLAVLVEAALGGPADTELVTTVQDRSDGNALFVRELVTAGLESGAIRWRRGSWRLDGDLGLPTRLVDVVQRRIAAVEGEALDALRVVAVGAPLPTQIAASLAPVHVLDDLERTGLVTTRPAAGGSDALHVGHPLIADAVLAAMSGVLRRRVVEQVARAVRADDPTDNDKVLRWAVQRLDTGVDVPTESLTQAAMHAFSLLDHPLAERLARAAIDTGGESQMFEARLALGAALSAQMDIVGGEAELEAAVRAATDDGQRARALGRLGLHLAIRAGRVEDGLKVLRDGVDSLSDPAWRDFLRADLTKIEVMAGETPTAGGAPQSRDVTTRANECIAGALLGALAGDVTRALACAEEGLELAPQVRSTLPNIVDLVLLGRYLALSFQGDAQGAAAVAEEQIEQARTGRPEPLGLWLAVQASTAVLAGEPERAVPLAEEALPLLAERDFVGGFHSQTTAVLATARAQRGELAAARRLLDSIDPMWLADAKTALQAALAEAWVLHASGDTAGAARRAVDAASTALAHGLVVMAAIGAHEAVRLGHPDGAIEVLVDAAARAPLTLAAPLLRSAQAARDDDPAAMAAAGEELVTAGCPALGAEQLARAAALYRRRSQTRLANQVERRAAVVAPSGEARRSIAVAAPLAPREREIAALAAARWRTKEIADHLGISPRTVDNTLAKLYRKLEIPGRDQLAERLVELGLPVADPIGRDE